MRSDSPQGQLPFHARFSPEVLLKFTPKHSLLAHAFVLASFTFACASSAHAQRIEVYGTLTGLHATNVPTNFLGVPTNPPQPLQSVLRDLGPGGGLTVTVYDAKRYKIGADVRGADHTVLFGAKATLKEPRLHFSPYLQGSLGYINLAQHTVDNQYSAAELLAGIDVPLAPFLSLRLAEVGVGHAMARVNNSKPTFVTGSTGLVFRF